MNAFRSRFSLVRYLRFSNFMNAKYEIHMNWESKIIPAIAYKIFWKPKKTLVVFNVFISLNSFAYEPSYRWRNWKQMHMNCSKDMLKEYFSVPLCMTTSCVYGCLSHIFTFNKRTIKVNFTLTNREIRIGMLLCARTRAERKNQKTLPEFVLWLIVCKFFNFSSLWINCHAKYECLTILYISLLIKITIYISLSLLQEILVLWIFDKVRSLSN